MVSPISSIRIRSNPRKKSYIHSVLDSITRNWTYAQTFEGCLEDIRDPEKKHVSFYSPKPIFDEGVALIAQELSNPGNKTVGLDLLGQEIRDDGAIHLAKSLHENNVLVYLDLSNNFIGFDGVEAIKEALLVNRTLRFLRLSKNNVCSKGAITLAEALEQNTTLSLLTLDNNMIGDDGMEALLKALEENYSIETIALDFNHAGKNFSISFDELLARNRKYQKQRQQRAKLAFVDALSAPDSKGPLNRSKVMVVGQGKAGKSATVKSLLGEPFEPEWNSTIGVSLSQAHTSGSRTAWGKIENEKKSNLALRIAARWAIGKEKINEENEDDQRNDENNSHTASTSEEAKELEKQLAEIEAMERQQKKEWRGRSKKKKRVRFEQGPNNNQNTSTVHDDARTNAGMFESDKRYQCLREYDVRILVEEEERAKASDSIDLTIWDYGGQMVFYTLHHLFLTSYGIYILVVDMRELVDDVSSDVITSIKFWMNSIQLHAPGAPLFVVGTFLEEIQMSSQVSKAANVIKNIARESKFDDIVYTADNGIFFPVDNRTRAGIKELQVAIEMVVSEQPYVKQLVNISWLRCLDEIVSKGRPWLKLNEVYTIAKKQEGIVSNSEVDQMLEFFHELGMILHFTGTDVLRQTVTVNPQWLIDKLGCVIKDCDIHSFPVSEIEEVGLDNEMEVFLSSGLISEDLLSLLWKNEQVRFLLDLMRFTLILSDWNFSSSLHMYLIPAMIHTKASTSDDVTGALCVIDFSEQFLPVGVFERFVCLCVSHSGRCLDSHDPELKRHSGRVWFGLNAPIYLVQDLLKDTIRIYIENSEHAAECLNVITTILRKVDMEVMRGKMNYDLKLQLTSGKFEKYETARKSKRKPWFTPPKNGKPSSVNLDVQALMNSFD